MNQMQVGTLGERMVAAETIVDGLSQADYDLNYQPTYRDQVGLIEAVVETLSMPGITTPRQADTFSNELATTITNDGLLVLTGPCRETIRMDVDIAELAAESLVDLRIIAASGLKNVVIAKRDRGQYKKPRSNGYELLPDGTAVPAYMGDVVNGEAVTEREPDPSRIVAGAIQARDLEAALRANTGHHVHAAHEALLLPYEQAMLRTDPKTGKTYSVSADMLWAGLRTNQVDGEVVAFLEGIENTVGVKIGAASDERHIAELTERLNPDDQPGKLVFMLRLGLSETEQYPTILGAIQKHAPSAAKIFDVHGITEKLEDGTKVRHVGSIVEGINLMTAACEAAGVSFDGVHLETTPHSDRLECIDEPGQKPSHPGGIDPQLNPHQTERVLNALVAQQKL